MSPGLLLSVIDLYKLEIGQFFGKHKFSAFVSPKKTWEGFFGQFVGSAFAVLLLTVLENMPLTGTAKYYHFTSWASMFGFYIMISLGSCVGDLFESLYKRAAQVKDSNDIIQGLAHGGILDKWDSVSFCFVISHIWLEAGLLY